MDAVNRNIHLLLTAIQKSEVYRNYKKQEEILEKIRNFMPEYSSSEQIISAFRMRKREICFRQQIIWQKNQQSFGEIRK